MVLLWREATLLARRLHSMFAILDSNNRGWIHTHNWRTKIDNLGSNCSDWGWDERGDNADERGVYAGFARHMPSQWSLESRTGIRQAAHIRRPGRVVGIQLGRYVPDCGLKYSHIAVVL